MNVVYRLKNIVHSGNQITSLPDDPIELIRKCVKMVLRRNFRKFDFIMYLWPLSGNWNSYSNFNKISSSIQPRALCSWVFVTFTHFHIRDNESWFNEKIKIIHIFRKALKMDISPEAVRLHGRMGNGSKWHIN